MRNEADSDCTPLGTPTASMANTDFTLVKPRSRSVAPRKNGQPCANTSHCTVAAPFSGCLLCHQPSIATFNAANASNNPAASNHLFRFAIIMLYSLFKQSTKQPKPSAKKSAS